MKGVIFDDSMICLNCKRRRCYLDEKVHRVTCPILKAKRDEFRREEKEKEVDP